MKTFVFTLAFASIIGTFSGLGQTPKQLIAAVNLKFSKVIDYTAKVNIDCKIPFVKIDPLDATVHFRKPDKFKIRTKGILFLPRQNPNYAISKLADTNAYAAVITGQEMVAGVQTRVVNIIPLNDTDLVFGKFWIDPINALILRSQLTTKSNGTISIESSFGQQKQYALPDKMVFTIDAGKFEIPKALTGDMGSNPNKKQEKKDTKGIITLQFSNYEINKGKAQAGN